MRPLATCGTLPHVYVLYVWNGTFVVCSFRCADDATQHHSQLSSATARPPMILPCALVVAAAALTAADPAATIAKTTRTTLKPILGTLMN